MQDKLQNTMYNSELPITSTLYAPTLTDKIRQYTKEHLRAAQENPQGYARHIFKQYGPLALGAAGGALLANGMSDAYHHMPMQGGVELFAGVVLGQLGLEVANRTAESDYRKHIRQAQASTAWIGVALTHIPGVFGWGAAAYTIFQLGFTLEKPTLPSTKTH